MSRDKIQTASDLRIWYDDYNRTQNNDPETVITDKTQIHVTAKKR